MDMDREPAIESAGDSYLPNFCGLPVVLGMIVGAELLAIVLTLDSLQSTRQFLQGLSLRTLFVQWVALSSALALCLARPLLRRLPPALSGSAAWLLILAVAATVILAARHWAGEVWPQILRPDFLFHSLLITAIVSALILRHLYILHHWQRQVRAESEWRFQALQARIRPHFLFNSMNTIAQLTRSDPRLAEQVVEDLADLFRASLSDSRRWSTLGDELERVRGYLRIEQQRLGPRLRVEWALSPELPLAAELPPLILQPLVENAVYHGIEPAAEPGVVRIEARLEGKRVEIRICNSLPPPGSQSHRPGNRMALENIRERLHGSFGEQALLDCFHQGERHETRLHFPYPRPQPQ